MYKFVVAFTFLSFIKVHLHAVQFTHCHCSVAPSGLTLCNSMACRTPGFPGLYHLPELAQILTY